MWTRRSNTKPLTDEQSALVAQWLPYASKWRSAKCNRLGLRRAMLVEMTVDAMNKALVNAARSFREDKNCSFPKHLWIRLNREFQDAFAGRYDRQYCRETKAKSFGDLIYTRENGWQELGALIDCEPGVSDEGFADLVKGLLPRERQVLTLMFRDGLDQYEAAEVMGCSDSMVHKIKQDALKRLRYKLDASPGQECGSRPC